MAENQTNTKEGYFYGGDMLLKIDGKIVGHCTSHKISAKMGTRTVAVKAPASVTTLGAGGWEEHLRDKKGITISFDGLRHYEEMEGKLSDLKAAFLKSSPIEVESYARDNQEEPELKGVGYLTQLDEDYDADGDAKFSGQIVLTGKPEIYG